MSVRSSYLKALCINLSYHPLRCQTKPPSIHWDAFNIRDNKILFYFLEQWCNSIGHMTLKIFQEAKVLLKLSIETISTANNSSIRLHEYSNFQPVGQFNWFRNNWADHYLEWIIFLSQKVTKPFKSSFVDWASQRKKK